jgi:hypothetical protein
MRALEAHDAAIAASKADFTEATSSAAADAWERLEATAREAGWRAGEVGYLVPFEPVKEFALRRKVAAQGEEIEVAVYKTDQARGVMGMMQRRAEAAEAALAVAERALEPFAVQLGPEYDDGEPFSAYFSVKAIRRAFEALAQIGKVGG